MAALEIKGLCFALQLDASLLLVIVFIEMLAVVLTPGVLQR